MDVLCVGNASFDITMSAPHHPAADEKMRAQALDLAGGGPAANASVQVCRLGGRAGFVGYLGDDLFGRLHRDDLRAEGVDCDQLHLGAEPSAISQILAKPDGQRSVVHYRASGAVLTEDAVRLQAGACRVVLFDGHEPRLSPRLCQQARHLGIATVLDAGSLHPGTEALAMQVDHLVASVRFACDWTGAPDAESACVSLAREHDHVVVTDGARGLWWSDGGRIRHMASFPVEAVDSTGAGDAFHGAFALGLAWGMPYPQLLCFASAAGALACTRLGARRALPGWGEVRDFLQQHGHALPYGVPQQIQERTP